MNILLIGILLVNIAILAIIGVVIVKLSRQYAVISRTFRAFIEPQHDSEGKPAPSAFAILTGNIADMLARSLVAQAKATFMGVQSGEKRLENAVEGELALGLAEQNPLVAGVLNSFPAIRKLAKKNPGLVDMVVQRFINKQFGSPGAISAPSGNNHAQTQTSFKI